MTKKDYGKIAAALNVSRPADYEGVAARAQWERTRANIAFVLKEDNPLFDRGKFYRATES